MLKSSLAENYTKKANLVRGKPALTDLHTVHKKKTKDIPKSHGVLY